MIRIHSVHLMNSMHTHVSRQTISNKFSKVMIKLAEDPVPNIRFNVSKSVKTYWAFFSREHKMQIEQLLKKMAESDPDFDAKYYATKALEEVKLVK
jgi:serine/threonine-protein phosphatase 2A regulatory subunit A